MGVELLFALVMSLALTLALESAFFFLTGKRNRKDLLLLQMVNVLTNPLVVFSYWLLARYTVVDLILATIILELLAVLAEGYYYRKYGQDFKRPWVFSACANLFSYSCGALLQFAIPIVLRAALGL